MNRLLKAAIVLLLFFSLGLLALMVLRNAEGVAAARAGVDAVSGWLLVFRIVVVALLWWFWHPMIDWLFAGKAPSPQREAAIAVYKAQRNRFLLGFVLIELIVVQNVLGAILSGLL